MLDNKNCATSILFRYQRVITEETYVHVPVTDAVMENGKLNVKAVIEEGQKMAILQNKWRREALSIEPHPIQQPLPEDWGKVEASPTFDLEAAEKCLQSLQEEHREACQLVSDLWEQIRPLKTVVSDYKLEQHFKDGITFQKILQLDWSEIGGKWYHKVTKWVHDQRGVYASGYFPDTNQLACKIQLHSQTPWWDQRAILQVIPHLKPLANGLLHIGVFESSCAQHGSYYFEAPPGTNYAVENSQPIRLLRKSYGQVTEIACFTAWDAALQYIHTNHPFE